MSHDDPTRMWWLILGLLCFFSFVLGASAAWALLASARQRARDAEARLRAHVARAECSRSDTHVRDEQVDWLH